MNNSEIEKDVMGLLHRQIKKSYSLRRTHASQRHSDKSMPALGWALPIPLQFSCHDNLGQHPRDLSRSNNGQEYPAIATLSPDFTVPHPANSSSPSQTTPDRNSSRALWDESNVWCPYTEQDLDLLMYYFDHIHPRQFPFYKSTPSDIGRGWLLNLHLRTKPLCTATTTLSACDQAQFALGPLTNAPHPYEELEQQHVMSLVHLQDHLEILSRKTGASQIAATVEALACVIQLICFEVCAVNLYLLF
jgi:hypothetical protein